MFVDAFPIVLMGNFPACQSLVFSDFFSASQRRLHQWTLTADRGLLENSPPVNGEISEAGDFCQDVSNCAAQWWVMFPSKKSWLNCWRFWNDDQLTRDCYFEMYRNDHLPPYLLSLYKSHFSLFTHISQLVFWGFRASGPGQVRQLFLWQTVRCLGGPPA